MENVMEEQVRKSETSGPAASAPVPPPPKKKSKRRLLVIGAAGLVVFAAVVVYYIYFIAPYESTDDAFIDGYVTIVSSRVPGQVARLMVTDNQRVNEGEVLVELDPRDYETSLANAKADLATARSQSDEAQAQVKVSDAKVAQAQAAVTAAEAENQRAGDDLKRYESVESRAVSKTAFDLAQAQARSASADLEAARSQVKAAQAQEGLSEAAVETAAAAVQQTEAKVRQAELNLSYTKIIAPVTARITARTVQVGNYVEPGQALLAMVPTNVWVTANFKETQLAKVKAGQKAEIHVDMYNKTFTGRVDSIAGATGARMSLLPPENATGNFVKVVERIPVKIVLDPIPPEKAILRPGMNVNVTIITK